MKRKHPELYEILVKTYQQDISESFKVDFKALMGKLKERVGRNSPCPCASGKKFKKCCLRK
ncbi:MAG: SEC-C domain-containing protein [Lentisphaeria bacterium]|nr:SEC-C domain-containing protein [Lentisphaeria bacterium]